MMEKNMIERIFDLMIGYGYSIEELMDGRQIEDPETGEALLIDDVLKQGSEEDRGEYASRMTWAATRLDEYMEGVMNDGQFGIASELSGEYEAAARLDGFIMGFKAALKLMDPEAAV